MKKPQQYRYWLVFLMICLPFSLNAQDNFTVVKAKKGEGIYALLARNNLAPAKYFEEFIELNEKALGRNNSTVRGLLAKMVKDGQLIQPDRGLYQAVNNANKR